MSDLLALVWAFLDTYWRVALAVLIVWGVLTAWWEVRLRHGSWRR